MRVGNYCSGQKQGVGRRESDSQDTPSATILKYCLKGKKRMRKCALVKVVGPCIIKTIKNTFAIVKRENKTMYYEQPYNHSCLNKVIVIKHVPCHTGHPSLPQLPGSIFLHVVSCDHCYDSRLAPSHISLCFSLFLSLQIQRPIWAGLSKNEHKDLKDMNITEVMSGRKCFIYLLLSPYISPSINSLRRMSTSPRCCRSLHGLHPSG